jgi:hypothetical protein
MPNTANDNETPLFYRAFFLDILFDKRTRPFFIYVLFIIGIGTTTYHWLEGWSWLDSVYFVVITLTTIGYGDLHPTQPVTKLITIFYSVNGVILLLLFFDIIRTVRGWSVPKMKEKAQKYRSQKKRD